jgi:hypothetical protein
MRRTSRIYADDEGRKIPEVNGRPVPEHLLMLEDEDARWVINFPKVGELSGVGPEVTQVLKFRVMGLTRDFVFNNVARDDDERRRYQAAWRQLDRKMDKVRDVFLGLPKKS